MYRADSQAVGALPASTHVPYHPLYSKALEEKVLESLNFGHPSVCNFSSTKMYDDVKFNMW